MTDWAAKVLEGVPRYGTDPDDCDGFIPTKDGSWLDYDETLAAIARHFAQGDDLVEQATAALEGVTEGEWKAAYSKWEPNNFIVQTDHPCRRVLAQFDGDGDGPDDQSLADARFIAFTRQWVPEAAARIAALTAQVVELQAEKREMALQELASLGQAQEAYEAQLAAEAETARLRDRLARMEGALTEIDALDPEKGHIGTCSENAIRGLVLRMGEIARAARTDGGGNG